MRGWLEVDLILGKWAEENLSTLSEEELKDFEEILNMETVDIFHSLTTSSNPLPLNSVLCRIRESNNMNNT